MIIPLSSFGHRLQGKTAGRRHYALLVGEVAEAERGQVIFLSFAGVESVNASWMNMAVAPFVRWSAEEQNDYFPVLSHFPGKDLDELELVAKLNQQCYVVAANDKLPIPDASLVGALDVGLRTTLDQLLAHGEATGAELARQLPDEPIQATAWNNRLKDLYDKRLLLRRKEGRQQIYLPISKRIRSHG